MSFLSDIAARPVITQYAQGAAQNALRPIADFLAPTVNVATLSGKFKKYDEKYRFKVVDSYRGLNGKATTVGFTAKDANFNLDPHALDFPVDNLEQVEEEAMAEDIFKEGADLLADQGGLSHELAVIQAALGALTAGNINSAWVGQNVDPVDIVDNVILQVLKGARAGSAMGVKIVFGTTAWKNFKNHANVKGKFIVGQGAKGGQGGAAFAIPTEDIAGQLFIGNPDIRTSYMVFDSAPEGVADNIQFVLDNQIMVFASKDTPNRRDPSFMKTFRLNGKYMVPGTYLREDGRGEVIKFDWAEDIQVTNNQAGQLLTIT